MKRLICGAILLTTATTVHAELTLETHPLAVTSRGSAAIVLEASSSHAAVRVFGPSADTASQTTSTVLVLQPGDWGGEADFSSLSLTEEVLRQVGGPARLGIAVIRDDWHVDLDAFPDLPTPNVRWLLRADAREAQSLASDLVSLWEGIKSAPRLSYSDYRSRTREMFDRALVASRVLWISSDGRLRPLPDPVQFPTPLGWLYRAMLDEAGQSALAGCGFRPAYYNGGAEGGPWSLYSRLVEILETERPSSRTLFGRFNDKTREVATRILWSLLPVELLSEAVGFLPRDAGVELPPDVAQNAMTDAAIYAEFGLS